KVTPLRQFAARPSNPIDRPIVVVAAVARPDASTKRATYPLRRIFELDLKPAGESLVEYALRPGFGQHLKQRIHASFDRTFAQQVRAEPVDRADMCLLEALNRI